MKKRGKGKMIAFLRFVFAGWFTLASGLLIVLGLLWLVVEALRSARHQLLHKGEQDDAPGDVLAQALKEMEEALPVVLDEEDWRHIEYDLLDFAEQLANELQAQVEEE